MKANRGIMSTLLQGNCLELMKAVPTGSIDLIICDLPYGTTACHWDSVIPFDSLWESYNRVIKETGAILLFGSEPFSTKLRIGNFENYKYDLYWKKSKCTGFQHAKNKPLKNLELISVFSKGTTVHATQSKTRMTYNPQGLQKVDKIVKTGARKFGSIIGARPSHKEEYVQEYTNYPTMFLEYASVVKGQHPTQKPTDLLEYLIKTYSNEGDIVLDNCMGSGSTGVAAVQAGRLFVGMELDEDYFQIAKERILKAEKERL